MFSRIEQITNSKLKDERLDKLEAAVQQVSEQLTALFTQGRSPNKGTSSYPKPPRNYRSKDIECYNCEKRGHACIWLETVGIREMGEGASPHIEQEVLSDSNNCSHHRVFTSTFTTCLPHQDSLCGWQNKQLCLLDSGASCSVMQADHTLQTNLLNPDPITLINVTISAKTGHVQTW